MRIIRHRHEMPDEGRGAVVALGNFDGVHRGHRVLIEDARKEASARGRPLAVAIFEPYPREFFRPNDPPFRLTPFRAKVRLLEALQVDFLIVLEFAAIMAAMLAQDFVTDVLVRDLGIAHIVVGSDFCFGKNRAGNAAVLAYMGEMEGFGTTLVGPVLPTGGGDKISSSHIREALKEGKPTEAALLLGHWWAVEGHVAPGDKRGQTIGFPTANLKLEGVLQPAHGVYAVRARIEGDDKGARYDGVANFGTRPTFALQAPQLEVHLFDFSGSLYGQILSVELISYLRGEQKFAGIEELKAQIARDCQAARLRLAKAGESPPAP
jgi:riboflavin kinase/FMN adenylyltransferase